MSGFVDGGIPRSLLDVKGDLLVASADNTPVRLAAGSDRGRLVTDSSTAAGLKWKQITSDLFVYQSGGTADRDNQIFTDFNALYDDLVASPVTVKRLFIDNQFTVSPTIPARTAAGTYDFSTTTIFGRNSSPLTTVNLADGVKFAPTGVELSRLIVKSLSTSPIITAPTQGTLGLLDGAEIRANGVGASAQAFLSISGAGNLYNVIVDTFSTLRTDIVSGLTNPVVEVGATGAALVAVIAGGTVEASTLKSAVAGVMLGAIFDSSGVFSVTQPAVTGGVTFLLLELANQMQFNNVGASTLATGTIDATLCELSKRIEDDFAPEFLMMGS